MSRYASLDAEECTELAARFGLAAPNERSGNIWLYPPEAFCTSYARQLFDEGALEAEDVRQELTRFLLAMGVRPRRGKTATGHNYYFITPAERDQIVGVLLRGAQNRGVVFPPFPFSYRVAPRVIDRLFILAHASCNCYGKHPPYAPVYLYRSDFADVMPYKSLKPVVRLLRVFFPASVISSGSKQQPFWLSNIERLYHAKRGSYYRLSRALLLSILNGVEKLYHKAFWWDAPHAHPNPDKIRFACIFANRRLGGPQRFDGEDWT